MKGLTVALPNLFSPGTQYNGTGHLETVSRWSVTRYDQSPVPL